MTPSPKGEGRVGVRAVLCALLLLLPLFAFAHPANVPSSGIKVAPDGTFVARIRFDAIAFATGTTPKDADDGTMNGLIDGPDAALSAALADAAGRFRRGFVAIPGGEIDRLDFPTAESVRRFLAGNPIPRLPVMLTAVVQGHLARGARTVAFRYPGTFDTIIQTVEFPYREPASEPVDPGQTSSTLEIPTPEEIAKTAASFAKPREAEVGKSATTGGSSVPSAATPSTPTEKPQEITSLERSLTLRIAASTLDGFAGGEGAGAMPQRPLQAGSPLKRAPAIASTPRSSPLALDSTHDRRPTIHDSPSSPFLTYLRMGFTHILPEGIDHILFVLGLFLLGSNTKALLKQVTAFTVAHSITLALTAMGWIHLPGRIIEPAIAISIAFVAIENLFMRDVRPWRTAVVFLFGLVHGMGFAEVFAEAGLRGSGLLTALVSFNVGVELGQLSVVALAFAAVGWFRSDARYRRVVVVPASLVIALIALFWTAQRLVA